MQAYLKVAKKSHNKTVTDYIKEGDSKAEKGDHAGAAKEYQQAISCDPNSVIARYKYGIACVDLENFPLAKNCFDEVIRLFPTDPHAYNYHGYYMLRLSDYNQAIADFDKAIHLDSMFHLAYRNRAGVKCKKRITLEQ